MQTKDWSEAIGQPVKMRNGEICFIAGDASKMNGMKSILSPIIGFPLMESVFFHTVGIKMEKIARIKSPYLTLLNMRMKRKFKGLNKMSLTTH